MECPESIEAVALPENWKQDDEYVYMPISKKRLSYIMAPPGYKKIPETIKTYFITDSNYTKIGKALDIKARLRELQVGNPYKLILIAVIFSDSERLFHMLREQVIWAITHYGIVKTDGIIEHLRDTIKSLDKGEGFMDSDCDICEGTGYEDCFICRGSGEGMVDGTACNRCRGTGQTRCTCVLEPDDFEEDEERSRR